MVTGAGGMLADAVGVQLAAAGDEAFGVFFSTEEARAARTRYPRGAVYEFGRGRQGETWLEELERPLAEFRPDWLFHLAAWTNVDGCESDAARAFRSNADGCLEAALVARRHGARLLAISTDYVYDGRAKRPWREDDPTLPPSVYGRSKLAGEAFVRDVGGEHLVVRTAWLFGPNGGNFVDTIRARLLANEPVRVVNDQRGCPTLTTDLAAALRALAAREARGVLHVVNAGDATWYDLALEIARHLGREHLVSAISTEELNRPAPRPAYSVLDTSRYVSIAGAPLPDWRDALARYLALRSS
jgi:dTDP-4-dehydrorhamnose reductase